MILSLSFNFDTFLFLLQKRKIFRHYFQVSKNSGKILLSITKDLVHFLYKQIKYIHCTYKEIVVLVMYFFTSFLAASLTVLQSNDWHFFASMHLAVMTFPKTIKNQVKNHNINLQKKRCLLYYCLEFK